MKVAELETILSTEDISEQAQLHCLACRRRLAEAALTDGLTEEGSTEVMVTITHLSADLRDFQHNRASVVLTCGCSTRSIYHLI